MFPLLPTYGGYLQYFLRSLAFTTNHVPPPSWSGSERILVMNSHWICIIVKISNRFKHDAKFKTLKKLDRLRNLEHLDRLESLESLRRVWKVDEEGRERLFWKVLWKWLSIVVSIIATDSRGPVRRLIPQELCSFSFTVHVAICFSSYCSFSPLDSACRVCKAKQSRKTEDQKQNWYSVTDRLRLHDSL